MNEINLLPADRKPSGQTEKLYRTLKKISVITAVVATVVLVLFITAQLVLGFQLDRIEADTAEAREELENLQSVEQSLVLVKDRLQKITEVKAVNDSSEEIEVLSTIVPVLPLDVNLQNASLTPGSALLTINTQSSQGLTGFYSNIRSLNFKKITLKSFKYDQNRGYVVSVEVIK